MANIISLSTIAGVLPKTFVNDIIEETRATSVVASLSPAESMQFGTSNLLTLGDRPRAEFVGEGAQKAATDISFGSVTIEPHKAQVTVRLNNEVEWANENAVLDVIGKIKSESSAALTEALDLGLIHRLNPLTGTQTTWPNYLMGGTNRVEVGANVDANVRAAGQVLRGLNKAVNGVAMTPQFLGKLADLTKADGSEKYPEIGFGTSISTFRGIDAAVSPTVKGFGADGVKLGAFTSPAEAIIGDWRNGIRWGVQKVVPAEVIPYGDPDGRGDLKRQNQFALRVEIVYGWYVFTDRFVAIGDFTP